VSSEQPGGFVFGRLSQRDRGWLAGILREETVGGLLLLAAAVVALILANSGAKTWYYHLTHFHFGPAALHLNLTTEEWAADGLLSIFFFVAGLELKHELVHGSLRTVRQAIVPVAAALSGMVVPAILYVVVSQLASHGDNPAIHGWGIPMATDIAFALAVLAVVGRGLPASLRAFLLTLAVVDDLGAIAVIAIFYTEKVHFIYLGVAVALFVLYAWAQRQRIRSPLFYAPLALIAWWAMHASGVHATVAGIALGLLTRVKTDEGETESVGERLEHGFRPISAGVCVPVFAFLAAGVTIGGAGLSHLARSPIVLGIAAGLVLGKPIGVIAGAEIAGRLSRIRRSQAISHLDLIAIGALAGIGFTVSLLVSELAFPEGAMLYDAKTAVLFASVVAALFASVLLLARRRHYAQTTVLDAATQLPDVAEDESSGT